MDAVYLQGLRDAKALVDEGVFSKEVTREQAKNRASKQIRVESVPIAWQCAYKPE